MKIIYLANIRMPTEMAHGVQIVKACEAFAKAGHDIELVVPRRYTPIEETPEAYYGITSPFHITYLAVPDTVRRWGRLGFLIQILSFALSSAAYVREQRPDIVYGRDEHVLFLISLFMRTPIVWESHDGAWNRFARGLTRRIRAIITVTEAQRTFYLSRGVPKRLISSIPNGVDVLAFASAEGPIAARSRLGLPLGIPIALYAGAFGGWKGTATLFDAGTLLPESSVLAVIGGRKEQIDIESKRHPRIRFLGERPYRELADNLAAADICVLPNTGKDPISTSFTSPLKLLAYLAAGKAIVASDLPSVREIVEDAALLVPADDSVALAEAMQKLLSDVPLRTRLGEAARARAGAYDWNTRAERLIAILERIVW
ncbi:MAG: glycosyltransferase family 4 protein [Minisyncoccia bacterium]